MPADVALVLALSRRARELLISLPGLWACRRLGVSARTPVKPAPNLAAKPYRIEPM